MKLNSKSNQLLILFRKMCHFILDVGFISYSYCIERYDRQVGRLNLSSLNLFKTQLIRKQLMGSTSMSL